MTTKFKKDNLKKAFDQAGKRMDKDLSLTSASTSAGFIISAGQKRGQRKGLQVFVKVCEWDEALLLAQPDTGGLVAEKKCSGEGIQDIP